MLSSRGNLHLSASALTVWQHLEDRLCQHRLAIEDWFHSQWLLSPAPIYGSVDLRNAGFKLAPVDMNLFPAGFNNLLKNKDFLSTSAQAAKIAITHAAPGIKNILLIPENHTRNPFYWQNIQSLESILTLAGFVIRLGSLTTTDTLITLAEGSTILLEPIQRRNNTLYLTDFTPDMILLNNDLTADIPLVLQGCDQPLLPPPELGWHQRSKSLHFAQYAQITQEFSQHITLDPWLITPLFTQCDEIDFMQRQGESCLTEQVATLLTQIKAKYTQYGVTQTPYVVIKADAGTYGIAVIMVRHADEIAAFNRKQRTSMAKTKGGNKVHKVIIQEGVYSLETWGQHNWTAEPVLYLWGEQVTGGFFRVHAAKGYDENLNSPGMQFEPWLLPEAALTPQQLGQNNRFYAYSVVARLSMLAAAREMSAYALHRGSA